MTEMLIQNLWNCDEKFVKMEYSVMACSCLSNSSLQMKYCKSGGWRLILSFSWSDAVG